jgi:hypothetical protein
MKIVKVIHPNTTNDIKAEKESFLIRNYNVEDFLSRRGAEIIERTQETLKKIKPIIEATNDPFLRFAVGAAAKIMGEEESNIPRINIQEASARLVISETVRDLLQDITNQLEKIEIERAEEISIETARKKYPETQNLAIGTYTLHPRDSLRLTRVESYHKNLALEKDDELIVLLCQMGAKSLRIMEIDTEQQSGSIKMEAETVAIDVKGDTNLSSKFERGKDLLVTFEGNIVDIDEDLLEKSLWFSDDSRINSIFESRRFKPNKINEYTLKNTYTETFDFDFNLAAKYLRIEAADLKA